MRKTALLLSILLLLSALAACGAKQPAAPEGPLPPSEADCVLTLRGTALRMGDDFLPLADLLGQPDIEEGQACLSGGYDINYYYNGEETTVYTLAEDGKQLIYDVYTADPEVEISRGLRIGVSTKTDVSAAFGEPTKTLPAAMRYTLADGTRTLAFEFDGEVLIAVGVTDDTKTG